MDANMLAIIGSMLVVILGINGFFLKGIMQGQNDMRVEIAKLFTTIESHDPRISKLEKEVIDLRLSAMECRGKCENRDN